MKTLLKNRKLMFLIAILIILCCGIYFLVDANRGHEQTFDTPQTAKYIITYSTGEEQKEKAIVNYMDPSGKALGKDEFPHAIKADSIQYSPTIKKHMLFTHEQIYFDHDAAHTMTNSEMKDKYKFATDQGQDTVYASGYVEDWNMFYKHIPHGLSYEQQELGYFDLLAFFNEGGIHNLRIEESGTVAANQSNPAVYNFYGESGNQVFYEEFKYDADKETFSRNKGKIDLTAFMEENGAGDDDTYTIGKTLAAGDRIYQILHLSEQSIPYLLEYKIIGDKILYERSDKILLDSGETLGLDATAIMQNDKITYYSGVKPNAVITFDLKQKKFERRPIFDGLSLEEQAQLHIREIDGAVYLLKPDVDHSTFEIYLLKDDGSLEKLIAADLPKVSEIFSPDLWIADFYAMP